MTLHGTLSRRNDRPQLCAGKRTYKHVVQSYYGWSNERRCRKEEKEHWRLVEMKFPMEIRVMTGRKYFTVTIIRELGELKMLGAPLSNVVS